MRIGELIMHAKLADYGIGKIVKIYGDYCDAVFQKSTFTAVPLKTFISVEEIEKARLEQEKLRRDTEEKAQQERVRQEEIQRRSKAKRAELLITLRKVLRDDFYRADSFFEASCKDFISVSDYKQEKASFLETVRREAEQQERIKQETLRREAEAKSAELLLILRTVLRNDFNRADSFFKTSCADYISANEYEQEKASFIQHWVKETTGTELDTEQATAVASVHGHIQVIARAGSGKTTTLVNRALFLQKHCGVAPDEMLLLAFNRKAAEEIAERLSKMLDDRVPHVMTFHALAYAIVHPEESLLYNGPPGESQGLSRAFQQVIDDHLQIPAFKTEIRKLMLAHFREDWDRIAKGGYDKSKEELLQFRRSLPRESLRGEYVKSFGEKVIADFLFEHDISYKYERNHWWGGINYRPDFTIFKTEKSGVIIEYFGLKGDPDYNEMSQAKDPCQNNLTISYVFAAGSCSSTRRERHPGPFAPKRVPRR